MRLANKICLVTGAASGMGRAGAKLFAKEGASVVLVDRDAERVQAVSAEIAAAGGHSHAIVGDLTDDDFSRHIVTETLEVFGGLDGFWGHAGHPGPKEFEGVNMADYDLAMTLNLRSLVVTTAEVIAPLKARGGGSIVFTSSTNGVRGSPNSPIYAAGKFAVCGLARSLARRHGADRIRVNSVCPGVIDTPMLGDFFNRGGTRLPQDQVDEIKKTRIAPIPLGRLGQPEDIASAALFLLSDDSSFITGTELCVDGGTTA
jgi:Dehydrogenases with different specificities (related to short-chain alcohol dehydrogenases)